MAAAGRWEPLGWRPQLSCFLDLPLPAPHSSETHHHEAPSRLHLRQPRRLSLGPLPFPPETPSALGPHELLLAASTCSVGLDQVLPRAGHSSRAAAQEGHSDTGVGPQGPSSTCGSAFDAGPAGGRERAATASHRASRETQTRASARKGEQGGAMLGTGACTWASWMGKEGFVVLTSQDRTARGAGGGARQALR